MFRTRFNRVETKGVSFPIPSNVQQCDKDSTDINKIISRYGEQCVCQACAANARQPISEDVAALSSVDFNTMMQKIASLNNQFNELPADVRKKFGHNPANMLEFMQNPANQEEAAKLGLISKSDFNGNFNPLSNNDSSTVVSLDLGNQAHTQTVQGNQTTTEVKSNPAAE